MVKGQKNRPAQPKTTIWVLSTDGAIRPEKRETGLGVIVRDAEGQIRYWWKARLGAMTNNEAEYAAVIFALERLLHARRHDRLEVTVCSDSRVVVDQMTGRAEVQAPGLQRAAARLGALVKRCHKVTFRHISREQNRLADALAFEALEDEPLHESKPKTEKPNLDLWEQFISTWSKS